MSERAGRPAEMPDARHSAAPHEMSRATGGTGAGPTLGALATTISEVLAGAGIASARQEARDIIAAVTGTPRFFPVLHSAEYAGAEIASRAIAAASMRSRGAPFAYAVGKAAFRHLTLMVDQRVLIPRQETEQLVDIVLKHTSAERGGVVADAGTGSGAIALALATEGSFDKVIGTDISLDAINVAAANAAALAGELRAEVEFRHGSMLGPVSERGLRAVASNPPYISYDEARALPGSVRDWEPAIALFSDEGGVRSIRQLVAESHLVLAPGGVLAMEVDSRRASLAAELVMTHGRFRDVSVLLDLAGRERFVLAFKES